MRILFRPQAKDEAVEAQAWYEFRAAGLGLEFARALDAAVEAAARNPTMFTLVTSDCRRVLLRRFPFSMVHRVLGDEFLVVAVFHYRRDPSKLARRSGI